MRSSQHKALFILAIVCLVIPMTALAEGDQAETYAAYPGGPVPATGQTSSVTVEKSVTSVETGKPVVQIGTGGRTSSIVSSSSTITATYTTQAPPAAQQNVLLNYDVKAAPPTAVYFSGTFMPWPSFSQQFPGNLPALWVASSAGWSWYASCPVGGWIQNLMYVPYTGTMKLYEFYPDGTIKLYSYGFVRPGYKYIWFFADTPGRHVTLFTVFDKPSNYITIDVV